MKKSGFQSHSQAFSFLFTLVVLTGSLLRASEPTKDEKHLVDLQNRRASDGKYRDKLQEGLSAHQEELLQHQDDHKRNAENLKSAEAEIAPGRQREVAAYQSYKDSVKKTGRHSVGSLGAKSTMDEMRHAQTTLEKNRQDQRDDFHASDRKVQNEKTVLRVEQHNVDTESRYIAADDKKIEDTQKRIKDHQSEVASPTR